MILTVQVLIKNLFFRLIIQFDIIYYVCIEKVKEIKKAMNWVLIVLTCFIATHEKYSNWRLGFSMFRLLFTYK